ncbi:unnamed protein product [Lactuca virosa]|uniref:Uncharacterized protein n=1 Tax=Lactuca virosa TaxID=75947 RepID=A0AAU9LA33_9ASTR|nr:unnamed protein product [Lactuca virosa]
MNTRMRIEKSSILKMTAMMADGQVTKVDSIKVQSENDLFGYDSYTYLNWDDFEAVLTMDELTGAVIVSYMMEMVLYATQSGSNKMVKLNWVNVMCPVQPGSTEFGYYMLRFMKEIVEEGIEVLVKDNVRI